MITLDGMYPEEKGFNVLRHEPNTLHDFVAQAEDNFNKLPLLQRTFRSKEDFIVKKVGKALVTIAEKGLKYSLRIDKSVDI